MAADHDPVTAPAPVEEPWQEWSGVRLLRSGAVARLVLDRQDRLNALTATVAGEVRDALERCREPGVRAVIITGAGRAFCSGADLAPDNLDRRADPRAETYANLMTGYRPMILAIRELAKPVVASVNGPAVGVGCSLALACDLIVAAESAFFQFAFTRVGLIPDGGASLLLPRRIGAARALELMMLGERLPAARAVEYGLVNEIHADDALAQGVGDLARRLADGPTRVHGAIKDLANADVFAGLDAQLEREARWQAELVTSADHQEGIAAFRQRRPPRFSGR